MNRADLSEVVLDLTARAVRDAPLALHDAVPDILARVFAFDAAWWGWSQLDLSEPSIIHSRTRGLGPGYVARALDQLGNDPILARLRPTPLSTMALSLRDVPARSKTSRVGRDFGISEVLTGQAQLERGSFRFFVSLYRAPGAAPFGPREASDLRLLMRHLKQVLALSLRLDLAARLPGGARWALTDARGVPFLTAPGGIGADARAEPYTDELSLHVAPPARAAQRLGAREAMAAQLYASGLTARQVADRLGRSHNTVRNQVAAAYRKTGSRDRVALAQALSK